MARSAVVPPTSMVNPASIEKLQSDLSRYTRGNDRRMVLRTLDEAKFLACNTLHPVQVDDIAAAEVEAARERAVLNGVKFLGRTAKEGETDSYFLRTLREICGHMCDMDGVYDADPMALYGGLLLRLARSVAEQDTFNMMNVLMANNELILMPLRKGAPPPIDIEMYVESGNVHAKVTMAHTMGFFRRTDLEANGCGNNSEAMFAMAASMKPWVFLDGEVVERINFGSGSSVRLLYVKVPANKNSGYAVR